MGYCPTAGDMNFEYGNIHWANGGWEITGDSRISSKTSFNLLGGYIEFDMDTTKAHGGVNTNIYTVSMQGDNCGKDCYCDIQDNGSPVCMELDITENNGNCKFAITIVLSDVKLHTDRASIILNVTVAVLPAI